MGLLVASLAFVSACRPAPPPVQHTKVTVFGLGLEAGELLRQDALEEFSRTTGIQVELIPTPGGSAEQLPVVLDLLQSHTPSPDVYLIDVVWPGTLKQHFEDLTPRLTQESRLHFRTLLKNDSSAGRIVSLPFYMNSGMLFYRGDLLKKYGYASPPGTWRELQTVALRIQQGERSRGQKDFWGYVWQGAPYEGLTCNALEWQVSYGGGPILEDDGTITLNNVHTADAITTASKWVGSISPRSVLAYTESDTVNAFTSGRAAFMRHWSSAYMSVTSHMQPNTASVALLPSGPGGRAQVVGGFQLAVSRYSPRKREAAALVMYLTSKVVQKRRAIRRGYLPTYSDLYNEADFLTAVPQARVLRTAAENSWVLRPSSAAGARYSELSRLYFGHVHRMLSGQLPVRAGLVNLETSLHHLMDPAPPGPR